MNQPAAIAHAPHRLRVAVFSIDAARHLELAGMVAAAGHALASGIEDADVVLTDANVPPLHPAVVALGHAPDALGQLAAGAGPEQIDAALRAVAAGLAVRSPDTRGAGLVPAADRLPDTLLTPREVDVLAAMAEGLTNKTIARKLAISPHTVKFHVESLFRKLQVRSRAEAIAKSIEWLRGSQLEL